jgi:hypothetical protein
MPATCVQVCDVEKTRAIEWIQKDIETEESELAAKKSPLLEVEQGVSSDNDNDNDDMIQSTTEDHIVSDDSSVSYCLVIGSIRRPPRRN